MKTVTFEVRSTKEALQEIVNAVESGVAAQSAVYTFTSHELAQQVLTPERWRIVWLLCKRDAMPISAIACQLQRDVSVVREDVKQLLDSGIVDRTKAGNIRFPYREIKFDQSFSAICPAQDSGGRCRFP